MSLNKLEKKWENRISWMLAYAEEAMFANDEYREHHFATCARQWRNALEDLRKVRKKLKKKGE